MGWKCGAGCLSEVYTSAGQTVPAGSHVRLNLQTGEREVKLQDEDKFRNNLKGLKKGKRLDINGNTYTSQDLKSALAKFKEGAEMESSKEDKARQAKVKRLFRPIEELKKDFEELNVVIETDMQIMVRLINKFNSSSSSLEEKIAALFDLEYYVHQMDNAQDLLSFGGLQVVINGLNSTEPLVKEYAAFVLGAAFSSRDFGGSLEGSYSDSMVWRHAFGSQQQAPEHHENVSVLCKEELDESLTSDIHSDILGPYISLAMANCGPAFLDVCT
ncbi:hypothetical protein CB1_000475037 [Camelus ferus]|nr:hypothetical protein CB1_000475037 [Camelus ferus]